MQKPYEDSRGNTRCLTCGSKIEGGYCDCDAYEVLEKRNRFIEPCFSADCLVSDLQKDGVEIPSGVEIRLFNHKTNKSFYKNLSVDEFKTISRTLNMNMW